MQWCIAKNGGGYTQRGVAKGLKVPYLFMITEVSIRCQKNPDVGIRRIPAYAPPQYTTAYMISSWSVTDCISLSVIKSKLVYSSLINKLTPIYLLTQQQLVTVYVCHTQIVLLIWRVLHF